jgi:hypothetical protein
VIACDDVALRWLAKSLRGLSGHTPFRLGDGLPVGSDGKCLVEIAAATAPAHAVVTPLAAGGVRWVLPVEQARRYADLIEGMADYSSACHQYLEADSPDVPIIIVTKGEHDVASLRRLRDLRRDRSVRDSGVGNPAVDGDRLPGDVGRIR